MYIKTNKSTIYYEKTDKREKDIIILPGWGNTRITFNYIINYLKDDYTIYIIDYPGFGNSKDPKEELTLDDYAEFIIKLMKKEHINNPSIIAHSFGGRITSLLSTKYKIKINKIVLIDVAGIKRISPKLFIKTALYKVMRKLIKLLPKKKRKLLEKKLFNHFSSTDYKNLSNEMKKTFKNVIKDNLKIYYKNITQETLIIWGENDIDTPLKDAYLLNRIIKNSGLIVFKNKTHFSYLEEVFITNKILENFLKEKD